MKHFPRKYFTSLHSPCTVAKWGAGAISLSLPLSFSLSFFLIFVTVQSVYPRKNFCLNSMHTRRQPAFWHLYHVLASATLIKDLEIHVMYTHKHMYKCAWAHMGLLQSKQNEGGHMVHSPVASTSSPAKTKGGIQLSQLSHQKAAHCI